MAIEHQLAPNAIVPFAWDQPMEAHEIVVQIEGEDEKTLKIDKMKKFKPSSKRNSVKIETYPDGPTKVVCFSEMASQIGPTLESDVKIPSISFFFGNISIFNDRTYRSL